MALKNILVPLDGSKNSIRGFDKAIEIARASHGTITSVFVIPIDLSFVYRANTSLKEIRDTGQKILDSAKTRAAKKGIKMGSKILTGDPGITIVRYAHLKGKRFHLIIMGSRGNSGVKELFLGSTSNYVLHRSKIPVLIVK